MQRGEARAVFHFTRWLVRGLRARARSLVDSSGMERDAVVERYTTSPCMDSTSLITVGAHLDQQPACMELIEQVATVYGTRGREVFDHPDSTEVLLRGDDETLSVGCGRGATGRWFFEIAILE